MTINKSQGQSVEYVGINLQTSVFSHGQLYVAFSRCTSSLNCQMCSRQSLSNILVIDYVVGHLTWCVIPCGLEVGTLPLTVVHSVTELLGPHSCHHCPGFNMNISVLLPEQSQESRRTLNVVYKEVFNSIRLYMYLTMDLRLIFLMIWEMKK